MTVVDTRPQGVDFIVLSGDTLAFTIKVPDPYTGFSWSGQIRAQHDLDDVIAAPDAAFDFGTLVDNGDGTWTMPVTLSSVNTETLATLSQADDQPIGYVKVGAAAEPTTPSVLTYFGYWDVQVADSSSPPVVHTLVRGTITIDSDVSRA